MERKDYKVILSKDILNQKVVSMEIEIKYVGEEKSLVCKVEKLDLVEWNELVKNFKSETRFVKRVDYDDLISFLNKLVILDKSKFKDCPEKVSEWIGTLR